MNEKELCISDVISFQELRAEIMFLNQQLQTLEAKKLAAQASLDAAMLAEKITRSNLMACVQKFNLLVGNNEARFEKCLQGLKE